jgi:hypothetical protein
MMEHNIMQPQGLLRRGVVLGAGNRKRGVNGWRNRKHPKQSWRSPILLYPDFLWLGHRCALSIVRASSRLRRAVEHGKPLRRPAGPDWRGRARSLPGSEWCPGRTRS